MQITLTCNGENINPHCSQLGRCNDRLSERGILESLRLAKKLKNQVFDFIFCSDFGYRRTTTDLIAEELTSKEFQIIVDSKLREKDAEICSHLTAEKLKDSIASTPENNEILSRLFIKSDISPSPKHQNTETIESVYLRCQKFLQELIHNYPSSANILIVGNPIINSFIIAIMKGKTDFTTYITSPCSISIYEKREQKWREISFNQRDHLYQK